MRLGLYQKRVHTSVRVFFWTLAIVLGMIQAWRYRFTGSADGISYLDIGQAYFRGDWSHAINAYWSPFYSWLLGLAVITLRPSPVWLLGVQKLVNFIIFVGSLACFDYFLHELIRDSKEASPGHPEVGVAIKSSLGWLVLGYPLFIWASLCLISLSNDTPDILVGALVYLASGLVLRIRRNQNRLNYFTLGAVLGFGYLAKAVLLPLGLVFIGTCFLIGGWSGDSLRRTAITLATFILVCAPFVIAVSSVKKRITMGDAGPLNYAWEVNGYKNWVHWQGDEPNSGTPTHPTRRIFDSPQTFEFNGPITGTYSPWYDPSYWNEGIKTHFDLKKHLRIIATSARSYFQILNKLHVGQVLAVGLLALFFSSPTRPRKLLTEILREVLPFLPAISALTLYAFIYTESRYVAAFLLVTLLGIFRGIRPGTSASGRLSTSIFMSLGLLITLGLCWVNLHDGQRLARDIYKGEISSASDNKYWKVAEGLHQLGIKNGDGIAYIGHTWDEVPWAKLAQVRLTAEITYIASRNQTFSEVDKFWGAEPSVKQDIISAFARSGATAVVADHMPPEVSRDGWNQIGDTQLFLYRIGNP